MVEIVKDIRLFSENDWYRKTGLPVWRELHYDYLSLLQHDSDNLFEFMVFPDVIIPFYSNKYAHGPTIENYMNPLIGIMLSALGTDENTFAALILIPPAVETCPGQKIREYIAKAISRLEKRYENKKEIPVVLAFCSETNKKTVSLLNKISLTSAVASYNTCLKLDFDGIEDFNKSQSYNFRRSVRRWLAAFSRHNLEFRRVDAPGYCDEMHILYAALCERVEGMDEPGAFWANLKNHTSENLEWYGIFQGSSLVCFGGVWSYGQHSLLSILGRKDEKLCKAGMTYFVMYYKLIEIALQRKIKRMYASYGNIDVKNRFGFESINEHLFYLSPKNK
ncbi:MAG: hypothetical protein JSV88_32465 [Candidatus Aminicenantes bacterium]|nr:MAG: hypothetical protein JSV88_32465 [Candidatus Aminicenantes bacterium]